MAGMWGYRSYRGRTPKWKYALAVVLVLVIVAAICVIRLQQYIVYDETGTAHLALPWGQESQEEPEEPGQVELDIEGPVGLQEVRGFRAPVPLDRESWEEALQQARTACPELNAAAVTLKDRQGNVYFDSTAALSGTVQLQGSETALEAVLDSGLHTIAQLSCFADPRAAVSDVEGMGLKNTGGYIFYDGNNSQWLDPGKPDARAYLCEIAREAAALGFDEILLTDVGYPTDGKLDKIDYGERPQAENLSAFLEEMQAALEPYDAALSMEVPEALISGDGDEASGLALADIVPWVDRIYTETVPERIEALEAAVTAADSSAMFVPELEGEASEAGSCLLLL